MVTTAVLCVGCEAPEPVVRLYRDTTTDEVYGYGAACADEIDCGWADRAGEFEPVPCAWCADAMDSPPPASVVFQGIEWHPEHLCADCAATAIGGDEVPMA